MLAFGKLALMPLALTLSFGAAASAQNSCEIEEGKPNQVARATFAVQVASSSKTPEDAAKQLRNAVKMLTEEDAMKNPTGRNFVLGKVLVLWTMQPGVSDVATRGTLGYETNPEGTIDLLAAIDTAFSAVESAMPACAAETAQWRGQKAWVDLINGAIQQTSAGQLDSAETLARRSLVLYRDSPYGYMVMGNVAMNRGNTQDAFKYFKETVAHAQDSTYKDVRFQTLMNMGNLALQSVANDTSAGRDAMAAEAKAAFDAVIQDSTAGSFATSARQALLQLAAVRGDTAAIKASYAPQLANPAAYDYSTLMNAAIAASRVEQVDDAVKLFEGAYQKNPYHRDALYNVAIMLIKDQHEVESLPYIAKLVAVDPSNGDNYELYSFAYAGMQKRFAAASKASKNAKVSAAYNDSARVSTDSALKYNALADSLPVQVVFTEFTTGDSSTTISGIITNKGTAAKTYDLNIEFLGADGSVIATQQTSVGPVAPSAEGRFALKAIGPNIAAFRYAPLQ